MNKTIEIKLANIWLSEKNIINIIHDFIIDHVLEFNATGCVLGLSGGVDSTLVAILCAGAFNKPRAKKYNLELVCYMLPSKINDKTSLTDAEQLAKELKIRYEIIPVTPIVKVYKKNMKQTVNNKFHKGNLMSRIRANILHSAAAVENKLVVGTGNRSEDVGIGYYTLFGDGAVHISPIADLPKRIVIDLIVGVIQEIRSEKDYHTRYDGFPYKIYGAPSLVDILQRILSKPPSAELEEGQTDFVDLGYSYDTVEFLVEYEKQFIEKYPEKYCWIELLEHEQFLNQLNVDREALEELGHHCLLEKFRPDHILKDFLKRHRIAKKKAKLISPPICKLGHLMKYY